MKKTHETLMRGKPIQVDRSLVCLPTLDEIFDLGVERYLEYLQSIILDISELDLGPVLEEEEFSEYQIFLMLVLTSADFKNTFFEAMKFFTKDTFVLEDQVIISIKKKENIDGSNELIFHQLFSEEFWAELRKKLSIAHWQSEPRKYNYASAQAKAIMKKLKKNKEEVQRIKAKKGESDSLDLYELIGSVCAHSKSYNLFNVWGLTYYQFFDHYYRLNINDNYHFSLQSILAGADPKKVKVEHWASSIKKN